MFIFSALGIVAPALGLGAAALVLRAPPHAWAPTSAPTASRREHAARMRIASVLLALHTLLVLGAR